MSTENFEKWKEGMRWSDQFLERLAVTPKNIMRGLNNLQYIDWKKQQIAKVADIYDDEEQTTV